MAKKEKFTLVELAEACKVQAAEDGEMTEAELAEAADMWANWERNDEIEAVIDQAREQLERLDAWVAAEDERLGCNGELVSSWNYNSNRAAIEIQKAFTCLK